MDKPKICMRLDLAKVSTVDDVELGSEVTITVTGKVKTLRGPEEGLRESYDYPVTGSSKKSKPKEEKYLYPGSLEVEVSSVSIKKQGEFDYGDDD